MVGPRDMRRVKTGIQVKGKANGGIRELCPIVKSGLRVSHNVDMIWIPGGVFNMGSNKHYAEEAPVHPVNVDGFWIDRTPVTNREFRNFVRETGYVTYAEIAPDPKDYPGALPDMLKPASLVFDPPKHPVDLR